MGQSSSLSQSAGAAAAGLSQVCVACAESLVCGAKFTALTVGRAAALYLICMCVLGREGGV